MRLISLSLLFLPIVWCITSKRASYNSLLRQVAFCKQQSFDTVSRSTSSGPSILTSGKVLMGVGLSNFQFQNTITSCGKCIHIKKIENFFQFNDELTGWDYKTRVKGDFIVMVMDQCKDAICQSGFLDFDVYNETQPVMHGNPHNLEWEYIECPVGDEDKPEFLFCLGFDTCRADDPEGRLVDEVFDNVGKQYGFYVYPRNMKIPPTWITINGESLIDDQGWIWRSSDMDLVASEIWEIESDSGSWTLDWSQYFGTTTTSGYRGGVVVSMD